MAEMGHTELPGLPLIRSDEVIVAPVLGIVARCPNHPGNAENWEKYANLIVTAVNTYPAVEGLVKALEACRRELNIVRGGSTDGIPNAIIACIPEAVELADSALSRFHSLQKGGENDRH